jgi:cystathionine beta-lyase/cystathionine gamma-synthase
MASKRGFAKAIGSLPDASESVEWAHQLKRGRVPGPRMEHNKLLSDECGLSTKAVHAGTFVDPTTGAVGTPIFQTTTFLFGEHTYASFAQGVTRDVPIYTRYGNPNQWAVQEKIASLEGAESSVVFASGMAAIATTLQALTNRGGHIVTSYDVYGGTYNLMREDMHQIGREVTFVDQTDCNQIERAIQDNTQILYFETLTNPLLKPIDLPRLGQIAAREHLLLVVDNTFLTPVFLKPLEHGAHIVIHSGTKYLNGHSDLTCGCASGSRKYIDRIWSQMLKSGGPLDAMSCFLLERGLKTLAVRMRAHHENASALVEFLSRHPRVRRVHHPLASDYEYSWVRSFCRDGYGGVMSFEVEGGDEAALRLMDNLEIATAATSLGGVETLVSLPFNTSHSSLTARQRADIGLLPGLVRYSVGIEDSRDLIRDLERALGEP